MWPPQRGLLSSCQKWERKSQLQPSAREIQAKLPSNSMERQAGRQAGPVPTAAALTLQRSGGAWSHSASRCETGLAWPCCRPQRTAASRTHKHPPVHVTCLLACPYVRVAGRGGSHRHMYRINAVVLQHRLELLEGLVARCPRGKDVRRVRHHGRHLGRAGVGDWGWTSYRGHIPERGGSSTLAA